MKDPKPTLAGAMYQRATSMLLDVQTYADKIDNDDYMVLVQSCKKIMEILNKVRDSEIQGEV